METDKRLYVFDKKEIILIFTLILLISTTCFVFGVKVGKGYSFNIAGIQSEDVERVELLSQKEENLANDEKILEEMVNKVDSKEDNSGVQKVERKIEVQKKLDEINTEHHELLKDKIDQEVLGNPKTENIENTVNSNSELETAQISKKKVIDQKIEESKNSVMGKWTIQLGSHQNRIDAEAFADGFKVRGYEPIINQVYLGDRGVWFRVSLGLFSSIVEAKNYVVENQTLFEGQDYVFIQFD